jgi:hypothetical protein
MSRIDTVTFEFIDLLPPALQDGVVYISMEHRTVVHNCCNGCGERIVLGLSPAQWTLTFDGETITLDPSIGGGALACNSHYWIRRNKVVWAKPLTADQTRRSQLADRRDIVQHHEHQQKRSWRLFGRWKSRRK